MENTTNYSQAEYEAFREGGLRAEYDHCSTENASFTIRPGKEEVPDEYEAYAALYKKGYRKGWSGYFCTEEAQAAAMKPNAPPPGGELIPNIYEGYDWFIDHYRRYYRLVYEQLGKEAPRTKPAEQKPLYTLVDRINEELARTSNACNTTQAILKHVQHCFDEMKWGFANYKTGIECPQHKLSSDILIALTAGGVPLANPEENTVDCTLYLVDILNIINDWLKDMQGGEWPLSYIAEDQGLGEGTPHGTRVKDGDSPVDKKTSRPTFKDTSRATRTNKRAVANKNKTWLDQTVSGWGTCGAIALFFFIMFFACAILSAIGS